MESGEDRAEATRWERLLEEVPRHLFVPDIAVVGPILDDPRSWIDRTADPARWREAVDSDTALGTQLDDGAVDLAVKTGADPCALPTSSTSAPHLVAAMLDLLGAEQGDRVLEIGTGTGWTAALLARRVGEGNIVSVEIDAAVAAQAAENLRSAGVAVQLVTADGTKGWPAGAPYDRVHVTVGAADIPYAWVEQTRPGGVIVLPWMPRWEGAGHLLKLAVHDGAASGRLHDDCGFMLLRDQRPRSTRITGEPRESAATIDPRVFRLDEQGLAVAVAGLLPGVSGGGCQNADGTHRVAAREGDSHALAIYQPDSGRTEVSQRGPRDLWNELEDIVRRWEDWGRPQAHRYGVTITKDGLRFWLDRADRSASVRPRRA
ncbi:methyltransferase domain-containing protein [Actinomadura terrae]|uniref:methyltransferase domain-containing protein n=1 Tax=Actinomadura terrae TaxID=604353 RepID=UPI001FA6FCBE|nr:methyltransferase domain-containing protein [Actinomadura terrae]